MDKPIYRVTRDEAWLQDALARTEHLVVKQADGALYCETHQRSAEHCAELCGEVLIEDRIDDGRYLLRVVRIKPYWGRLTVSRNDLVVFQTEVGVMYDAPIGPDAEDVQVWREIAIDAADRDYRKRGEDPPG